MKTAASKDTQKADAASNVNDPSKEKEEHVYNASCQIILCILKFNNCNIVCCNFQQGQKTISTRDKTKHKVSDAIKSPYAVRAVTMSNKLTGDERELYFWMMSTEINTTYVFA